MFTIYRKFIKEKALTVLIYTGSMIAFLELYVGLYPSMAKQANQVNELVKSMPKGFLEAFGVNASQLSFNNLESLLATKHFALVWPLVMTILAISLSNAAITGEIEDGTLAVALSQPVSRTKIFLSRYLAGLTLLAFFGVFSIISVFPLAKLQHIAYSVPNNLVLLWSGLAFSVAVFSLAYLASSLFSTKARSIFLTTGILIIMYVVSVIATLKDSLKNIQYSSFFYYFNAVINEVKGEYIRYEFWVFLLSALILMGIGVFRFSTRDVEV